MKKEEYCRPGDSTSISLPFGALHKGIPILFSFVFLVADAIIFLVLSSLSPIILWTHDNGQIVLYVQKLRAKIV